MRPADMSKMEEAKALMRRCPLVPQVVAAVAAGFSPKTVRKSIRHGQIEVQRFGERDLVVSRSFLRKLGEE